jgi:hypothetical protein
LGAQGPRSSRDRVQGHSAGLSNQALPAN